jgi:hypothetical protein
MKIQAKIRHTSKPIPSSKSKAKCIIVPVSPLDWQPHFFSLASKSAENAELKKSGRMPMAGFTRSEHMPTINRMRKAGGKVASDIARRQCGVDLVKMVRLRTGPAMITDFRPFESEKVCEMLIEMQRELMRSDSEHESLRGFTCGFVGGARQLRPFQAVHKSALRHGQRLNAWVAT